MLEGNTQLTHVPQSADQLGSLRSAPSHSPTSITCVVLWQTSPQSVERTGIDRFKSYVTDIVSAFRNDSRVLYWEVGRHIASGTPHHTH